MRVCLALCLCLVPVCLATILTTAATGTAATITLGLATTTTTAAAAANAALATAAAGAAAVVGALAAGALLDGHLHRKKRDLASNDVCANNFQNEDLLFILAANSDQLGCGQRLVCELEATHDDNLTSVEQSILDLFGRNPRPLKASQALNPKSLYHYAAQVGSKAANTLECAEVFDLCPMNRAAIMEAYNTFAHATSVDSDEK